MKANIASTGKIIASVYLQLIIVAQRYKGGIKMFRRKACIPIPMDIIEACP